MENLEQILRNHAKRYPLMEPQSPYASLPEIIGNGMAPVMPDALDRSGYSAEQLGCDFIAAPGSIREA